MLSSDSYGDTNSRSVIELVSKLIGRYVEVKLIVGVSSTASRVAHFANITGSTKFKNIPLPFYLNIFPMVDCCCC